MYKFEENLRQIEINGKKFNVDDFDEETVLLILDLKETQELTITIDDFPQFLQIEMQNENGFETYLFYDLEINAVLNSSKKNLVKITFSLMQPNKYWEGKYGLSTFLGTLNDVFEDCEDITVEYIDLTDPYKELQISFLIFDNFILNEKIAELSVVINLQIKQAERILSGVHWRPEYDKNESLFSTEILYPLLRKMGFVDVRFTHGVREYGKDFTFSELTRFGNLKHYGLQAKAGNLRGNVNADIDEIIGQLNDAFSMPYHEISANENRQISTFIVAISGKFTDNSKDKISHKIPNYFKGSVYFIDKDKILELIEKYW